MTATRIITALLSGLVLVGFASCGTDLKTKKVRITVAVDTNCDLSKYYPDLGNGMMVGKANSFLWYCRVWNQTTTNWIQATGTVRLK